MDSRNLRSVNQAVEENPWLTHGAVRWLIFNADSNGLESALVRVGNRVFIDVDRFNEWLEERRGRSKSS